MVVNQAACRLGMPWIDAGISADGWLARVRVFGPGAQWPCLECGWDQADYDVVEQAYPCAPGSTQTPTRAPSALAALAASLQAIECDRLLAGDIASELERGETLLDARHQKHYVTAYRRNAACRMPDHAGWRIDPFDGSPATTTVDELFALGSSLRGAAEGLSLGVAGQRIVTTLHCSRCETQLSALQLQSRGTARGRCAVCGDVLRPHGLHRYDVVPSDAVASEVRDRTLSECGFLPYDVLTLSTPEVAVHLELPT
jgi:hypothetical protein